MPSRRGNKPDDIVGWALVYADGARFTSDDGTWAQAPDGVQILLVETAQGWNIAHGVDTYRLPGKRRVIKGELMPHRAYEQLLRDTYASIGLEHPDI